jgi:probable F420-dependent oxidoreductase
MQLGVIAAWVNLDPMTPRQASATAARVEQLGYSALWFPDSLTYDSLTRASTLLAATSTLVVATGITCIYNRPAWSTGAAQRVLFDQSDGRFLLGLGVSHKTSVEESKRVTYGPPVATMRAYLSELDAEVTARDRVLTSVGADDRPSLRGPRMPRVISALGPKMLELARDECNGAHPFLVTADHTHAARTAAQPDHEHI